MIENIGHEGLVRFHFVVFVNNRALSVNQVRWAVVALHTRHVLYGSDRDALDRDPIFPEKTNVGKVPPIHRHAGIHIVCGVEPT